MLQIPPTNYHLVAKQEPYQKAYLLMKNTEEFSTPELTFCAHFYSVHSVRSVPPHVPQWHVKDPGHSAKSACGRLQLNTHTSLTQRSRSGLTMPLSMHSVGSYQETSSHATRKGTLG